MTPDEPIKQGQRADRDLASLADVLTSARLALRYVSPTGKSQFASDQQLQDAVIRRLELIGEAARRISPAGQKRWPHLPWREMIGMRNVVIHNYDEIDLSIVWETVDRDLPVLIQSLEDILSES